MQFKLQMFAFTLFPLLYSLAVMYKKVINNQPPAQQSSGHCQDQLLAFKKPNSFKISAAGHASLQPCINIILFTRY